jgi:hypothetical protein
VKAGIEMESEIANRAQGGVRCAEKASKYEQEAFHQTSTVEIVHREYPFTWP